MTNTLPCNTLGSSLPFNWPYDWPRPSLMAVTFAVPRLLALPRVSAPLREASELEVQENGPVTQLGLTLNETLRKKESYSVRDGVSHCSCCTAYSSRDRKSANVGA